MSETTLIDDPHIETSVPPPEPAPRRERTLRARKQRRFMASLRFNALRYLTLAATLLLAWGLVVVAGWSGTGPRESTFLFVLAGGLLAAAGKTAIDILSWAESNRQAVHVERVRAVQRVFQRACDVREQAVLDWRRIHTILVDNLSGESREVRLFRDHDETDRQGERLLQKGRSEETWIRADGVDAIRRFKKGIAALDYDALSSETEFLEAFDARMEILRRDLAVAAIGIRLE